MVGLFLSTTCQNESRTAILCPSQRHDENLADYIAEIKLFAQVLCLPHSENSTVKTLLSGFPSGVQSYCCFADRPENFQDLARLCAHATETEHANSLRNAIPPFSQVLSAKNNKALSRSVEPRECFYCHQRSPVIGNCPVRSPKKSGSAIKNQSGFTCNK
jgi:hypothetical protein